MADSRRIKVVYLSRTLRIGGAERQIVELAARLDRQQFEPKLYCISGGGLLEAYVKQHSIETTIFDGHQNGLLIGKVLPMLYIRRFLALTRYLQRERPDIVHTYLYSPSVYGRIAAKLSGTPVVITSRRCLEHFKDGKPHYHWVENVLDRFVDQILVNSQAVKQRILQRETIAPEKIGVIYNGVDTRIFKPVNGSLNLSAKKEELGIPETSAVVGIIANLIPYKGHRDFILAASEVHRRHPDTHFLCVGEDRGIQGQLEQLSRELGLRQHVIFTGPVQNVPEILQLLDIQVSASYQEGFSNTILEGMASGKPIVATTVGGTPEAVLHNVTGLLIPPGNPSALAQAITTLLDTPELARNLGHNGRKRVEEHFSMKNMVKTLERLYLTLSKKETKS